MKRAVSISLGSSKRDKAVEIDLLGERVRVERIGTDGDMARARQLYTELDGDVDAFGFGGADLGVRVGDTYYRLHSVRGLIKNVKRTPVVDGAGLKATLERDIVPFLESRYAIDPKRVLFTAATDRWDLAMSFYDNGYECIFGDFMFALGLPLPVRTPTQLVWAARFTLPVLSRLPFRWLYPTGEKQEQREPKHGSRFAWATVIAGDCHYILRHMPDRLDGKFICTNTTTEADVARFRDAGVRALITTTPLLDGRTFGTNMMEAALVAASGERRPLTPGELRTIIANLNLQPAVQELNPAPQHTPA